ncbi:MAG: alpha/beta hydrolase [Desulfobulbaceae bacterium]|nr:alpha/beta hydrolase [Desulfobulbaceae bacterium]
MATIVSAITFIVTIYMGVGMVLYLIQHRLLYYPMKDIAATPEHIGLDYTPIRFRTSDNLELSGWFIPGEINREVILFCHGNAGNISHRLESIRIFHRPGYGVFIFDYRGYGESEGVPSEEGIYLDACGAWDYLINKMELHADNIVVFGRSLGGAVAARLSAEKTPLACILESTFTSLPELAFHYYPIYPSAFFCRMQYDTLRLLRTGMVRCPVLIIHSREDEIIPFEHGRELFDASGEKGMFLEIVGDHNNGFLLSGTRYTDGIRKFVNEAVH